MGGVFWFGDWRQMPFDRTDDVCLSWTSSDGASQTPPFHVHLASHFAVLLFCSLSLVGCRLFDKMEWTDTDGRSPLRPATPSADSSAVEIFVARIAADDVLQHDLWQHIDEQAIPNSARKVLSRNGFRAGVVGSVVPVELSRALQLEEVPADKAEIEKARNDDLADSVDLAADATVTRQWRRLRPGQRAEINASGVLESLPILLCDEDGLHGETIEHVQTVYALRVTPAPPGQAKLELTPEVHFGPAKTRYIGGEGPYWRMDVARDRRVYDRMRIPALLRPGQMLVIGTDAASAGSLGDHFHRVDAEKGAGRRLIVIRLAEVPDA